MAAKKEHFGGKEFIDLHKRTMEDLGFWDEVYKSSVIKALEITFKREIMRDMFISDIVFREGDRKVLIKWVKRHRPLTDEELKEQYGN